MELTTQQGVIERLRTWAEEEIARFNEEMVAGGEPVYPQDAAAVISLLNDLARLQAEIVILRVKEASHAG
jgi:hypothetical protein